MQLQVVVQALVVAQVEAPLWARAWAPLWAPAWACAFAWRELQPACAATSRFYLDAAVGGPHSSALDAMPPPPRPQAQA